MLDTVILGPYILSSPSSVLKGINNCVNMNYPNARNLMNISLTTPSKIKDNEEYVVKKNSEIKKMRSELGLPESKSDRILIYSKNSDLAHELSTSKNIRKAVQDWKSGKIKNSDGTRKTKFVVAANDSEDMKRAINGCTLTGLKENPDGSVSGYIYDIYNFDSHYTDMKDSTKNLNFVNKVACYLQKMGIIHNYQILVPITIKTDIKS